jgi:hypothetical protein
MSSAREPKDRLNRILMPAEVMAIADLFQIEPILDADEFREKGNINFHTYSIGCAEGKEYLLQCINGDVFKKPVRIMEAMEAWIGAQNRALELDRPEASASWEPITLIPAEKGGLYVEHAGSIWRLMKKIGGVKTFKSLEDAGSAGPVVAREMGRGLALTADFARGVPLEGLTSSLPGYRDTRGYYAQLKSVLSGCGSLAEAGPVLPADVEVRESTESLYYLACSADEARARREDPELAPFIELALKWEGRAMTLQDGTAAGVLGKTAIHGDTKIENFLFHASHHQVVSLVDLDTIMPYTWLADWGDMIRSLVNVAGEKETNLDRVRVDRDVFRWTAEGFLSASRGASEAELDLLLVSVQAIALELGVRFLADYLRGDNYFALGPNDPPHLNKTRAMVQLTLFQRLLEAEEWAGDLIGR